MKKSKVREMFSVISKYEVVQVRLFLLYGEKNILLNELVMTVKDEQEAKSLHEGYVTLMIEKENALYYAAHYLAKTLKIDYKGKNTKDVVKLVNQKMNELKLIV